MTNGSFKHFESKLIGLEGVEVFANGVHIMNIHVIGKK